MEREHQSRIPLPKKMTLGMILDLSPPRYTLDMDMLKALVKEDSFFVRRLGEKGSNIVDWDKFTFIMETNDPPLVQDDGWRREELALSPEKTEDLRSEQAELEELDNVD